MKQALLALVTLLSITSSIAQTLPEMTNGDIRKIDVDNQTITIKHSYIKNIDMPAMTMVFMAKDKTILDGLAVGDKVHFTVEMVNNKFVVTKIVR
jgi:Cu(I)/Ag(I) efflux system periplasmic protein CusF